MNRNIKAIFLSVFALCATLLSHGQTYYDANVAVGGKAGVALSKVSFNPSVPQSWNMGTLIGGSFRYMEEKHFGIIVEALMEQRGWKENFGDSPYNYQHNLTYIQVPILTHIYFGSRKFRGFVNLGPELGYMISNSVSANFDYTNIESIPDFPSSNRHLEQLELPIKNKFDYGISFGLGMEMIAMRKHSIVLEGRLYYGLGHIFSSHKSDTFSGSTNMSLQVSLGYMFRIK